MVARLQVGLVGRQVRLTAPRPRRGNGKLVLQGACNRLRNLILDGEHVDELTVVALRPEMTAVGGDYELRSDADAISRPADASLEHVRHAERGRDLPDVGQLAF